MYFGARSPSLFSANAGSWENRGMHRPKRLPSLTMQGAVGAGDVASEDVGLDEVPQANAHAELSATMQASETASLEQLHATLLQDDATGNFQSRRHVQ